MKKDDTMAFKDSKTGQSIGTMCSSKVLHKDCKSISTNHG